MNIILCLSIKQGLRGTFIFAFAGNATNVDALSVHAQQRKSMSFDFDISS